MCSKMVSCYLPLSTVHRRYRLDSQHIISINQSLRQIIPALPGNLMNGDNVRRRWYIANPRNGFCLLFGVVSIPRVWRYLAYISFADCNFSRSSLRGSDIFEPALLRHHSGREIHVEDCRLPQKLWYVE